MSLTNLELNISPHYCHLLKFLRVQQFSQTLFCTHFATFLSGVTVTFYCFHNKLPQAQWFKTTQLNHLQFQSSGIQNGSRWPNIRVSAGLCLSGDSRGILFSGLFQLLEASSSYCWGLSASPSFASSLHQSQPY